MKAVLTVLAILWAADARADALLTSGKTELFPTRVAIDVAVRAQIESTTITLEFPPLADGGDFSLTVPAPPTASPIGVDVDRGAGFIALPAVAEPPAAAAGGSSSPALAAWYGTAPLVAELVRLDPGPLAVRVRFVRVLRRLRGEVAFEIGARRCPSRPADDPGPEIRISARIDTARDLTRFTATGGTGTTLSQEPRGASLHTAPVALADAELVQIAYAERSSGLDVQLVAHRAPGADPLGGDAGYFVALIDADATAAALPRSISLVIDRSGSMGGAKIAQARDAARAMLDHLRPDDTFAIHTFDDGLASLAKTALPATDANIARAREFIKEIADGGSTDLDRGIRAGIAAALGDDRFSTVVLLSDGVATAGETDRRDILERARAAAGGRTRMFTFSVGADADFPLMEALARGSRGRHFDLNNAQATSELVQRARELFEDIRDVRFTDLDIAVGGIGAADTLPDPPPDLFGGGQVLIAGRYTLPGTAAIRITGREGGAPFTRTFELPVPALAPTDDIVKYVWATEKVRSLMAEIAGGAPEATIRAEVESLGLAYRIQTPYTRFSGGGASDTSASCAASRDASLLVMLALAGLLRPRSARRSHRVRCPP